MKNLFGMMNMKPTFNQLKIKLQPHLETRIKSDASRAGLRAALEQRSPTGWHTVAFASRFLNSNEERYSVNELELLGVVWSVEYFKQYFFWQIIHNHHRSSSTTFNYEGKPV